MTDTTDEDRGKQKDTVDLDNLQVGQEAFGVEDMMYPYLTVEGDEGHVHHGDKYIGEYVITKVYRDATTNESRTYDLRVTKVYRSPSEVPLGGYFQKSSLPPVAEEIPHGQDKQD